MTGPRPALAYAGLDETSGYGIAARRLLAGLRAVGRPAAWVPFRPGGGWGLGYEPALDLPDAEVLVGHLTPEYYPHLRAAAPGARLVAHTVWETDRLPAHWPALLDLADRVVVPCRWNAEVVGAAVRPPVAVVPHVAIDPVPATHPTWAGIGPDTFVVLALGPWTARKALDLAATAFLRAFRRRDDVLLVLLTSPRDETTGRPTAVSVARLLAGDATAPAVHLVNRKLDDVEMAALHTRTDCFLSLCRSEGWGLGSFDAGAYGNEVVITGFGGHLDYLDAGVAHLVDHRPVPVDDPAGGASYTPDQTWAEPSVDHAVELLRAVHAGRDRTKGRALARRITEGYAPAAVARTFLAAL